MPSLPNHRFEQVIQISDPTNQPRNKSGRPKNPDGRKVIANGQTIVRLDNGTWVKEHRKILEDYLERKLRSTEKVKWIDGNKSNNVLSNLEIWEEVKTWSPL